MTAHPLATEFAPSERTTEDRLDTQLKKVNDREFLTELLEAVGQPTVILNANREIVFANRAFLGFLEPDEIRRVIGFRAGEALGCAHSDEKSTGCGTTQFCSQCGVTLAILRALDGQTDTRECRITRSAGEALDVQVHAAPFEIAGERFVVLSLRDISGEKRREVLERLFFHDVMNMASIVKGLAVAFDGATGERQADYRKRIIVAASKLLEELSSHHVLVAAERHELACVFRLANSREVLEDLATVFRAHEAAQERRIAIDPASVDQEFTTDRGLLTRVLGNLLRNALEASQTDESVMLSCNRDSRGIAFHVHNEGVIPPVARLQVFQRSFSTKGPGRGLGTYSVKLLVERFLGGHVWFTTAQDLGTTFTVRLPLAPLSPR